MSLNKLLIGLVLIICIALHIGWNTYVVPGAVSDIAIQQMNRSDDAANAIRAMEGKTEWPIYVIWSVGAVICGGLIFKDFGKENG